MALKSGIATSENAAGVSKIELCCVVFGEGKGSVKRRFIEKSG